MSIPLAGPPVSVRRPFLPKGSDLRFYLLIFAIFGSSITIFFTELVSLPLSGPYTGCIKHTLENPQSSLSYIEGLPPQCGTPLVTQLLLGILLGVVLVFATALVIYLVLPVWRRKTEKFSVLTREVNPALFAELDRLSRKLAGNHIVDHLPQRVHYYTKKANGTGEPYVFGRRGWHGLFLPNSMLQVLDETPSPLNTTALLQPDALAIFRAKILHEMAHIVNQDIGKTYFTRSIWRAFWVVALAPYILVSGYILLTAPQSGTSFAVNGLIRVALLALIVALIYAAVLRSRELEADEQASAWSTEPGERATLAIVMGTPLPTEMTNPLVTRLNQWRISLFAVHPPERLRADIILGKPPATSFNYWQAFGIGLTFATAFPAIYAGFYFFDQLLTNQGYGIPYINYNAGYANYPDAGLIILCTMLVFALAQMIWQALNNPRRHGELRGVGRLGLAIAAGLLIGFIFSLFFTTFAGLFWIDEWRVWLVFVLPWPIILGIGFLGFSKWLAVLTQLWAYALRSRKRFLVEARIHWTMRLGVVLSFLGASVILAASLTLLLQLLDITLGYLLPTDLPKTITMHIIILHPSLTTNYVWNLGEIFFILFLQNFYLTVTLAGFWVLPLLATFWAKWVRPSFRQQQPPADGSLVVAPYPLHGKLLALVISITCVIFGLVYGAVFLTLAHFNLLSTAAYYGPYGVFILFGPIFLSTISQVVIAAIIFTHAPSGRVLNALLGAFLGGLICAAIMAGAFHLSGNQGPRLLEFLAEFSLNWGAIYAIGTVLVLGIVLSLEKRQRWRAVVGGIVAVALVAGLTWLAQPEAALAANRNGLVTNGDFERPVVDAAQGSNAFTAGQSFAGWTVGSGTASVVDTHIWFAAHGGQSLDLPGNESSVYQDLATTPGKTYTIRFAMAGDPTCLPLVKQVQVRWGTTSLGTVTFDITGHDVFDMGWNYSQFAAVRAMSANTRLQFNSLISSDCGPAIDDVSVTG